jgi:hypothetical protein
MRKLVKVGIPVVGLLAASFVVGACAGGGGGGSAAKEPAAFSAEAAVTSAGSTAAIARSDVGAGAVAAPAETAVSGGGVVIAPSPPIQEVAALAPNVEQRIIQTATLSLTVPKGDFDDAVNSARSIVAGLGGFVTSSSTTQGADQRLVRGTLVLRVPQPAYAQAMSQLTRLGKVRAQQETGEDVSGQYVDLSARQRHLEAVEAQLLAFLKRTNTVSEALAVQSRLNNVQLQLEEVRGQLRYLDGATAFATITLDVAERGAPLATKPKETGGSWSLADAWHAAANGFKKVLGGVLVAIVVAGPILAGLALLLFGGRLLRRRASRTGPQPGGPAQSPLA